MPAATSVPSLELATAIRFPSFRHFKTIASGNQIASRRSIGRRHRQKGDSAMATTTARIEDATLLDSSRPGVHAPPYQAFQILHWGFVAAPVLAGLDKFFGLLANWDAYLSPAFASASPLSTHATMQVVGVVEMI